MALVFRKNGQLPHKPAARVRRQNLWIAENAAQMSRLTLKQERYGGCAKAGAKKYSGTAQSAMHRSWSILNEGANGGIA
jgi:hypothetical protein